jgi:2'-5' RNA ligase
MEEEARRMAREGSRYMLMVELDATDATKKLVQGLVDTLPPGALVTNDPDAWWVKRITPADWHMTLLGPGPSTCTEALSFAMHSLVGTGGDALQKCPVHATDVDPSFGDARKNYSAVVLKLEPGPNLMKLRAAMKLLLPDGSPYEFNPHCTVAYVKRDAAAGLARRLRGVVGQLQFSVRGFKLSNKG